MQTRDAKIILMDQAETARLESDAKRRAMTSPQRSARLTEARNMARIAKERKTIRRRADINEAGLASAREALRRGHGCDDPTG